MFHRMHLRRPTRHLQVEDLVENFVRNLSGFGLHLPTAQGGPVQPVYVFIWKNCISIEKGTKNVRPRKKRRCIFKNCYSGKMDRLFLGNPGDYVWGRDGLDTIVTQLLNQMDGSGPPPLPRKQIDEIPIATVSQTQIGQFTHNCLPQILVSPVSSPALSDIKLQCSICWEDFVLAEIVRQLPCKHIYHTPCIEPWLELVSFKTFQKPSHIFSNTATLEF